MKGIPALMLPMFLVPFALLGEAVCSAAPPLKPPADSIAYGMGTPLNYTPNISPFVLVGNQLWNVLDRKPVGKKIGVIPRTDDVHAIYPDGKFVAVTSKSDAKDGDVSVWSTDTGEKLWDIPGSPEAYVDVLAFAGNQLLVGGRQKDQIDLFDVNTGKLTRSIKQVSPIAQKFVAVSSDGKLLAISQKAQGRGVKMAIFNLETGTLLAVMEGPRDRRPEEPPVKGPPVIPNAPAPRNFRAARLPVKAPPARPPAPPIAPKSYTSAAYSSITGLAFSPDSRELAMVANDIAPRLVVWNRQGNIVFDEWVDYAEHIGLREGLIWMPDGSGWLVGDGFLVDRKLKRVVWMKDTQIFAPNWHFHPVTEDKLLTQSSIGANHFLVLDPLPLDSIRVSKAAMAAKAAVWAPGDSVSLEVDLHDVRGDPAATKKAIEDALTERLYRENIKVADAQRVTIRFAWSESAGESLSIVQKQGFQTVDTGRKATEAKGGFVLQAFVKGSDKPVWSHALNFTSGRMFMKGINDTTLRASLMGNLEAFIDRLDIPYFIPSDPAVSSLPIVHRFTN